MRLATEPFLIVAGNLVVLTYNLGVLLYAIPIPSRRIKKWAPLLIEDSIYAALLIMLFSTVLYVSDYIAAFSGVNLYQVASWLEDFMHNIISEYIVKRLLTIPAHFFPGGGVVAALALLPLTLIFYGVVTATASLLVPLYILLKLRSLLTALGILLYALPFRLGRNAGASLIAFAIVGNIVFHFLPHWVILFTTTVEGSYPISGPRSPPGVHTSKYLYPAWGLVAGAANTTPVYGLLMLQRLSDNASITYLVQRDGAYYAAGQAGALPAGRYRVVFEYMGLRLLPLNQYVEIPHDLSPTYTYADIPFRLDFVFKNVVFLPQQAVFLASCYIYNTSIEKIYIDKNIYHVTIVCEGAPGTTNTALIAYPRGYTLLSVETSNIVSAPEVEYLSRPWRGVPVEIAVLRYTPEAANYTLSLEYSASEKIYKPIIVNNIKNKSLLDISIDIDWKKIIDFISPSLIAGIGYTVAAFSFLTVMSSLVLSFARFLGAYAPRIIFEP